MDDPCDIELNAVYSKTKRHLVKSCLLIALLGIVYCSAIVYGCAYIAQSLGHMGAGLVVAVELGWYGSLTLLWLYLTKVHHKWSDRRFDEFRSEANEIIEFHYPTPLIPKINNKIITLIDHQDLSNLKDPERAKLMAELRSIYDRHNTNRT